MHTDAYRGLKILDFTANLPGPLASATLAQLGAEVWKVEAPGRPDPARGHAVFEFLNAGKSMVEIDLKSPGGRAFAHELVGQADVLLESFRPGVMKRLGLGSAEMHQHNPRLIYCSISAFGRAGPLRDRPGHDIVPLAEAGVLNRHRDAAGALVTTPLPVLVGDVTAGLLATIGIQAALEARRGTGLGQILDVSMLDASLLLSLADVAESLGEPRDPKDEIPAGSATASYGVFVCADGRGLALGLVAHEDHFWSRMCTALGLDALAGSPARERHARRDELTGILEGVFRQHSLAHWQRVLADVPIPWAPARTLSEAVAEHRDRRLAGLPGGVVPLGIPGPVTLPSPGEPGSDTARLRDTLSRRSDGEWLAETLAVEPEQWQTRVLGRLINCLAWGQPDDPPMVLLHGGLAHARWWSAVAPLVPGRRVVAMDLTGHGESDWRDSYDYDTWAQEVAGVIADLGSGPAVVVGHSMGGWVAMRLAANHPEQVAGIVVVDSATGDDALDMSGRDLDVRGAPTRRSMATRDKLVERFRPLPEDSAIILELKTFVAERSVRRLSHGWEWQFDPLVSMRDPMDFGDVRPVSRPVWLVRGERGLATEATHSRTSERLGGRSNDWVIAAAGHHIMLERPRELAALIASVPAEWQRTARQVLE